MKNRIILSALVFSLLIIGYVTASVATRTIGPDVACMPYLNFTTGFFYGATDLTNNVQGTFSGAISAATLDTGQGAYELFAMNQDVESTDAVTFATVDTGQGANELYDMDQNVLKASAVEFQYINATLGYNLATTDVTNILKYPQEGPGYYIFTVGSTHYAVNGITRAIDYSGTNETTVINNALSNLSPYSKIVVDRTFQYIIEKPLNVVVDGTIFEGLNYTLANGANCHGIYVKAKHVTVSECVGDGDKASQVGESYGIYSHPTDGTASEAEDVLITNCYTHEWLDIGIRVDSDKTTVTECSSWSNGRDGIAGDVGTGLKLINNVCWDNVNLEIGIGLAAQNVLIADNLLVGGGGVLGSVFVGGGCTDVIIDNNIINGTNTANYGIGIGTTAGDPSTDIIISNNHIYNAETIGIGLERDSHRVNIIGNYINGFGNTDIGIRIVDGNDINIVGNYIFNASLDGIGLLTTAGPVSITGNHLADLGDNGIEITNSNTGIVVSCNKVTRPQKAGIYLINVNNSTVSDNVLWDANQAAGGAAFNSAFVIYNSDYNLVHDNLIESTGAPFPKYGILEYGTADYNDYKGNKIGSVVTSKFVMTGANTRLSTLYLPFIEGTTYLSTAPFGWEIDLATEYAITHGTLPEEVNQVVQWKIWATSVVAEAQNMTLQIEGYGATDNEAYNTESIAIPTLNSTSLNFGANDVIYWVVDATDDADLDDMFGGDQVMIKVLHEAASGNACQTDAVMTCVIIEYV